MFDPLWKCLRICFHRLLDQIVLLQARTEALECRVAELERKDLAQ